MHFQASAAKTKKYGTSMSGDTFEFVERPLGGFSFVLADGQRSGHSAKAISNMVVQKAVSLIAEGVRDEAAARATNDFLYTRRRGRVSATLNISSIDLHTSTVLVSRNTHCPVIVQTGPGEQIVLAEVTPPIGFYQDTEPEITEFPFDAGTVVVAYTDGLAVAGERRGAALDVPEMVDMLYRDLIIEPRPVDDVAQGFADTLLSEALFLDDNRPKDDTSILVVAVLPDEIDNVRRFQVRIPIPPVLRP